jgi:signal peptidase I
MLPIQKYLQVFAIALATLGMIIDRPGWCDVPAADNPMLSESVCLKLYEESLAKARSGNWQISEQDRRIMKQCQVKFSLPTNPNTPLPKVADCLAFIKSAWQGNLKQLTEIDFSEEQWLPISRCKEVAAVYYMPAGSMLPTLKIGDRFLVDKTIYQRQNPQRGDIIIFNPTEKLR